VPVLLPSASASPRGNLSTTCLPRIGSLQWGITSPAPFETMNLTSPRHRSRSWRARVEAATGEGRRATSCSGQRPEALNCQPWIIASWPFSFRPSWAEAAVMAQDEPLLKCVHAWQARETEPQQDAEALALQLTKSTVLSAQISTLDRSADLPSAYFPSRST
jgi:hypothetical protein